MACVKAPRLHIVGVFFFFFIVGFKFGVIVRKTQE